MIQLFEAWWNEFERKHAPSRPDNIKLMMMFKSQNLKPKTRPYECKEDEISSEPMKAPLSYFSWLPFPGKKLEVQDFDMQHFERYGRMSLRTLNFIEVSIQAFHKLRKNKELIELIMKRITFAIKTLIQLQLSIVCGVIQLRRDHYIMKTKGLAHEQKIRLRHSKVLGEPKLFNDDLLIEINKLNRDSIQDKAFLRVVTGNYGSKKNDNQQKQGGQKKSKQTGQQPSKQHQGKKFADKTNNNNNNWSVPTVLPPLVVKPKQVEITSVTPSAPVHSVQSSSTIRPVQSVHKTNTVKLNYEWTSERMAIKEMNKIPVGGRLVHYWRNWKELGASKKVVRWARKGYMLPFIPGGEHDARSRFTLQSDPSMVANYEQGSEKAQVLTMMMNTLLQKNVIKVMSQDEPGFFNLVFLRPKNCPATETRMEKRWRLILDVSGLNKFLYIKKFKMETAEKIRNEVCPNTWATSVDLTDAYHHIPIHAHYHQFLAFEVAGVKYKYTACPFGLSPIPQVFTELMTCIKIHMRENYESAIFQYIDDWLLFASTPEQVIADTITFVNLCIKLGVVVNPDKSQLEPTQSLVHLGFQWNFELAQISVPDKKAEAINKACQLVIGSHWSRIPILESLMGKLVSVEKVVPYGRTHYRFFQRELMLLLRKGRNNRPVRVTDKAKQDLIWWSEKSRITSPSDCSRKPPDLTITTDASLSGWGACVEGTHLSEKWTESQQCLHINELELLAVLKTLQYLANSKHGSHIRFMIDNKTACAYITKQGGTKSIRLNTLAQRINRLAEDNNITLTATFIKGQSNVVADILSRTEEIIKTEWSVSQRTFQWICQHSPFGPPQIDLFANHLNHRTHRYISPCPDSDAWAIDALTCQWPKQMVMYAFPPTTIMEQTLQKIKQEKPGKLILIAPNWPMTTWFTTLTTMSSNRVLIPHNVLSLVQPHNNLQHPNPSSISLAMWVISFQSS